MLKLETNGAIEVIGSKIITLAGGMGGTYVKTIGKPGNATLIITGSEFNTQKINFNIKQRC